MDNRERFLEYNLWQGIFVSAWNNIFVFAGRYAAVITWRISFAWIHRVIARVSTYRSRKILFAEFRFPFAFPKMDVHLHRN